MAFMLITHGIPGEADLIPRRDEGSSGAIAFIEASTRP
jgi:hypothetical protein